MSKHTSQFIIGFSDSLHDRSVCLFKGADIVVAIEEERLSRAKHALHLYGESRYNPAQFSLMNLEAKDSQENEKNLTPAMQYCLDAAGITLEDVAIVAGNSLHKAVPFRERAIFLNHHLAHATSTFFSSGFENAAILVADGYGDLVAESTYETVLLGSGLNNQVKVHRTVSGKVSNYYDMENSLGVFYRIGTLLSGFGLFDEGKTMGLSSYGLPKYRNLVMKHVRYLDDEVQINNGGLWEDLNREVPNRQEFEVRADIAATFQLILNEVLLFYVKLLHRLTKTDSLCIAGGVGLNCVANSFLLENSPFKDIFVFPAPGDNGISFGAAYFVAHTILGLPRSGRLDRTNFGRTYSRSETWSALAGYKHKLEIQECNEDALIERTAQILARHDIVMWFQMGAEIGPRALGYRSILANPGRATTKDYINEHVKFREMFRPLAPIVMEEQSSKFFGSPASSPFMLFAPKTLVHTKAVAPGIVHVDDTARVQTVNRYQNPQVYALVGRVGELTGTSIILNTSFNGKDEPIVETPAQALTTFMNSPVKNMVLNGFFITKLS